MWIVDTGYRNEIQLWIKEGGISRVSERYSPFFYLHLPDPHAYMDMIESLEGRFNVEECSFRTIYGPLDGYKVHAGRRIADLIEKQTAFSAKLYNVDVRVDQRFLAEKSMFPCGHPDESRYVTEFEVPLDSIEIRVKGNPCIGNKLSMININDGRSEELRGSERRILWDLFERINELDPDLILFPNADHWLPLILRKTRNYGLGQTISRSRRFAKLGSRSYWSYGRVEHRAEAIIPEGRILIDTESSFNYRKGGVKGVLLASRLTGLSPNLTSRFTPGTLVSSYETYEAIRRGIAVPRRKSEPESLRGVAELRSADRGGMMFQPFPGIYERAYQLDFASLYPSIIVNYNLSPETLNRPDKKGFLADALKPLLELRLETKCLGRGSEEYAGMDAILKWMLVTSFGYTGYRNAKFGGIQVHERITSIAREILLRTKEIAESMDFEVLHGLVDCLWLRGERIFELKERVENEMGIRTELERYDWLVFLPMEDGGGAYNRYYGKISDNGIKFRGIMAKRSDVPDYVRRMQLDMFEVMREAEDRQELAQLDEKVRSIYDRYLRELRRADPKEMVIMRRISTLDYSRSSPEASAVKELRSRGIELQPGMIIGYVIRDASKWLVDPDWVAKEFDARFYGKLLKKAWIEIAFIFEKSHWK